MTLQGGHRFFFEFEEWEGFLSEEESWHAVKVLRKKIKNRIYLINGKGKEFLGEITGIQERGKRVRVKVKILDLVREENIPLKKVFSFVPLLKGDKTEFLIEKGTELGVDVFIPFTSKHSVVKLSDRAWFRLKTKASQALKQSGRLFLPEIMRPVEILPFIETFVTTHKDTNILKIVGLKDAKTKKLDTEMIERIKNCSQIVIISGPEGGFSKDEEERLLTLGFFPLNLSPYVLRAETASLALMSLVCVLKT